MTEQKTIDWKRGESLYLDLPEFEEEVFIFHDGEHWVIYEMQWDGYHEKHYADASGAPFGDIEAAREFMEARIAGYEAEATKEEAGQDSSN